MSRLSPEVRRQAIVDAALAVALRKGIATTTVRDVAIEMGTSMRSDTVIAVLARLVAEHGAATS